MSLPRSVLPGTTYLISRRCSERRLFLRPSPATNRILLYCLAVAAARTGVRLHAFGFLSNHYHLVATDRRGQLPTFMHIFNLLVARALNARYGRFEAFWASGTYSAVELADREAIIDKIAYTLANPVAAGLVVSSELWPGAISSPQEIGATPRQVARPEKFFRRDGGLPPTASLSLEPPPGFEDLSLAELRNLIAARVAEHEAQARLARRGQPFLGRRRVRKQSIYDRPRSHEPRFGLNPRVAGRDTWKRMEALQRRHEFLRAYRRARAWLFGGGSTPVTFPAGTWLLRTYPGVVCAAPS
jgi:putative transposase